jgi:hypothetical protein
MAPTLPLLARNGDPATTVVVCPPGTTFRCPLIWISGIAVATGQYTVPTGTHKLSFNPQYVARKGSTLLHGVDFKVEVALASRVSKPFCALPVPMSCEVHKYARPSREDAFNRAFSVDCSLMYTSLLKLAIRLIAYSDQISVVAFPVSTRATSSAARLVHPPSLEAGYSWTNEKLIFVLPATASSRDTPAHKLSRRQSPTRANQYW